MRPFLVAQSVLFTRNMLLLAHPIGNTFFRAAARSFYSVGWLQELDSCICWNSDSALAHFLPASFAVQLRRRTFTDVPLALQHSHHWRELGRLFSSSLHLHWFQRHEKGPFSIDAVYRSFDRYVAHRLLNQNGLRAIYAYEDGALRSFQVAERLGLHGNMTVKCLIDKIKHDGKDVTDFALSWALRNEWTSDDLPLGTIICTDLAEIMNKEFLSLIGVEISEYDVIIE